MLLRQQQSLDPDLMLHLGAERSTLLEREEGRAERILANFPSAPAMSSSSLSNSGRNAYLIEMAQACKARGATTIALTSLRHAYAITSRHHSGNQLYEVTDLVLDNGGEYGDAALSVGEGGTLYGPDPDHRRCLHSQCCPCRRGRQARSQRRRGR